MTADVLEEVKKRVSPVNLTKETPSEFLLRRYESTLACIDDIRWLIVYTDEGLNLENAYYWLLIHHGFTDFLVASDFPEEIEDGALYFNDTAMRIIGGPI